MRLHVSSLILLLSTIGAACSPTPPAMEATTMPAMQTAVWAPQRIYAPLDGFTQAHAEIVLRGEATKECGADFESRTFVVASASDHPMLAMEYACLGHAVSQGDIEAPHSLQQ